MKKPPYIGITDFTKFAQVEEMLEVFHHYRRPNSQRLLHVGVMMSHKTLNDLPTKWAQVFPPQREIKWIFSSDSDKTFNCLHFADYDHRDDFYADLIRAMVAGGDNLSAIQLDMIWPSASELDKVMSKWRIKPEVILQVGKNAIEEAGNEPAEVVRRLEPYEGLVDRVLLDKSMGRGLGMDATALLPFARAIRERFLDIGIGAAGGLGPKTLHLVAPLVKEFPDISIDAQGQLRPSGNTLDPIDCYMAGDYLVKALAMLEY